MTQLALEEQVRALVDFIIPIAEAIGAIVIGVGVVVAFVTYALSELRIRPVPYARVRLLLGQFLALGLEFQLASDILSTAVSPSFAEIGKLGAIAAIRTLLNYFLSRELAGERANEHRQPAGTAREMAAVGTPASSRPPDTTERTER
jgi:uncharacterized membrane protein